MTAKPIFTSNVSLGTFIQIGSMLVIAGIGFQTLRGDISTERVMREKAIVSIEVQLKEYNMRSEELRQRTRFLEEQVARTDERFSLILSTMGELKSELGRLTEKYVNGKN